MIAHGEKRTWLPIKISSGLISAVVYAPTMSFARMSMNSVEEK
jgi:hypothetical protein